MKNLEIDDRFCLDLREIFTPETALKMIQAFPQADIVYVGSSFCGRYFLSCRRILEVCKEAGKNIILTVPVLSQNELAEGKMLLASVEANEIIVNDYAMLKYVRDQLGYQVGMGRLFFKEPRDGRLPVYLERAVTTWLDVRGAVSSIELDPVCRWMNLDELGSEYEIAMNSPWCYMSFGRICKYASIHQEATMKYRSNTECSFECRHVYEIHRDQDRPDFLLLRRIGKAIYFENTNVTFQNRKPDRILYFPLREMMGEKK